MAGDTDAEILERIEEIIDANGSVDQRTKDRLLLMGLAEVLRWVRADWAELAQVKKDCVELQRNSILLWVRKNPALAGFAVVIILISWNALKLLLMEWLGLPVGMLP